jgi:hypothetical protein
MLNYVKLYINKYGDINILQKRFRIEIWVALSIRQKGSVEGQKGGKKRRKIKKK